MTPRKLKALGSHLRIICVGQELRTRTRDLPGFGGMCHHTWQHLFLRRGQRPCWPPSAHTSPATSSKPGISRHESPTQLAALVNFQMTVRQTVKLQLGRHSGSLDGLPLSASGNCSLLSPSLSYPQSHLGKWNLKPSRLTSHFSRPSWWQLWGKDLPLVKITKCVQPSSGSQRKQTPWNTLGPLWELCWFAKGLAG